MRLFPFQYGELKDSMTDALINDKPQFVRLFCENGLNILEYLTHERLESLYRSLSDSLLVYNLLKRILSERQSLAGSLPSVDGAAPDVWMNTNTSHTPAVSASGLSLFEVSCTQKQPSDATAVNMK